MIKSGAFSPADALAGLSLAGLLLPEAVAYSGLAGLPPQAGVIGLFAGLVCYAIIGRSPSPRRPFARLLVTALAPPFAS